MPTQHDLTWDTPTVFLSDLHINGGKRDQKIINNLKTLFSPHTQPNNSELKQVIIPKRLVLLGDIFDFNLAYPHTIFQKHFAFYVCLRDLSQQGIEIFVFTGNHDPEQSCFLSTLGITIIQQAIDVQLFGKTVRLEHGDLLEPNLFKRLLCHLVRSSFVRFLARCLPANLLWSLTQHWGTQEFQNRTENLDYSLHKAHQKELDSIIKAHWPILKKQGIDHWVFGHFHQALAWPNPSSTAQVFVLGEQVNLYTYLYWDEQGASLKSFNEPIHDS